MSESYRYTVRFPNPLTHYAEIEAWFPASEPTLELFMAVWTPGSYLIREYSRHVENLAALARDGRPLNVRKSRKNRWSIETRGEKEVRVTYRLYCHEMSVRTNWVGEDLVLLQGAATFLSVVGKLDRPHIVTCGAETRTAADYDALVDSPILLGEIELHEFECGGKKHYLVNAGAAEVWDSARATADIQKIVEYNLKFWGSLPYEEYRFLNILVEGHGYGGLEHKDCCCLITSRYGTRSRAAYTKWLTLVSHEFFHVWNVKRLRPVELGPFDYENENYTRSLWVAEGFTEYYGSLNAARAGVITRDEYLALLSTEIETLQTTPGRFTRAVDLASYDAWIRAYRPDENSINATISYYTKGAAIAFLFDAQLRTGGTSLDDAMRNAYQRYPNGFSETAFTDRFEWLRKAVTTTEELDYAQALEWFGLRFKTPAPTKATLGITTKVDNGRLIVAKVPLGTAGFSADDEILAIDGYRVLPGDWTERMEQLPVDVPVEITVSRRGKLTPVRATPTLDPDKRWTLEVANAERVNAWLEQPRQP